jgi:hypothetical protein
MARPRTGSSPSNQPTLAFLRANHPHSCLSASTTRQRARELDYCVARHGCHRVSVRRRGAAVRGRVHEAARRVVVPAPAAEGGEDDDGRAGVGVIVREGKGGGRTTALVVPDVAEAAQSLTPSLKNFLLSIVSGGVVLVAIVGAVVAVSNFDPVKRA